MDVNFQTTIPSFARGYVKQFQAGKVEGLPTRQTFGPQDAQRVESFVKQDFARISAQDESPQDLRKGIPGEVRTFERLATKDQPFVLDYDKSESSYRGNEQQGEFLSCYSGLRNTGTFIHASKVQAVRATPDSLDILSVRAEGYFAGPKDADVSWTHIDRKTQQGEVLFYQHSS